MGKKQQLALYSPNAVANIEAIIMYITEKGYPDTARKFGNRLFLFGNSLCDFPNKYPTCKYHKLRNYRCAPFHKNYIFIYKVFAEKVKIFGILHMKSFR